MATRAITGIADGGQLVKSIYKGAGFAVAQGVSNLFKLLASIRDGVLRVEK